MIIELSSVIVEQYDGSTSNTQAFFNAQALAELEGHSLPMAQTIPCRFVIL